jgi:hypothetical protein
MYLYLKRPLSNETWLVPQFEEYTRLYHRSMAFTNHLLYRRHSMKIALKPPIQRLRFEYNTAYGNLECFKRHY